MRMMPERDYSNDNEALNDEDYDDNEALDDGEADQPP